MNRHLPTVDKIKLFFPKHRICVVKTLLLLLDCVLQYRTVNLINVNARLFRVTAQKEGALSSIYTRLIRFFEIKRADSYFTKYIANIKTALVQMRTLLRSDEEKYTILSIRLLSEGISKVQTKK